MRRSVWLAAWSAPVLLAGVVTADAATAEKKHESKQKAGTSAPTVVKPGESGLIVIRDEVTGELRAPEAGEAAQLLRQAVPADNHSDEGLVDVPHPRGGFSRDLQGRFQEYLVVTRAADGTLKHHCVNDAAAAERVVTQPPTSSAQGGDR
jgi:hypothetical protein